MTFVNQKMEGLGLSVQDLDTQVGARLWGRQGQLSGKRAHRVLGAARLVWPGVGRGVSPLRALG